MLACILNRLLILAGVRHFRNRFIIHSMPVLLYNEALYIYNEALSGVWRGKVRGADGVRGDFSA